MGITNLYLLGVFRGYLYLLSAYNRSQYDIRTFCQAFEQLYYPDVPLDELTSFEFEQFENLAKIVVRFSPFEEDIKAYPKVYYTEEDVKTAINTICSNLTIT